MRTRPARRARSACSRTSWASRSWTSTCAAPAARAGPSTSSSSCRTSTATTLYPGGILNTGFALNWAKERVHDALPASPSGGQPWAYQRIQEGDQTCAANQALHPEAVDLLAKVRANDHYVPEVADPLSPDTFVNKVNVPT